MHRRVILAGLVALGACGNDKMHTHMDGGRPDAPELPWWTPKPGETPNWDIQIGTPYDTSADRTMYIVDLFDSVPAATDVAYPSGTVSIPAGVHSGTIAALKGKGTKVICRVGIGAIRLSDPDHAQFPGDSATVPDDPELPASGSVIGWSTGVADERFLDPGQLSVWMPIVFARISLAKQIGCDGVDSYREDLLFGETGFTAPPLDQQAGIQTMLYTETADAIHEQELSAGMRVLIVEFLDSQVANYDWLLFERCGELDTCEAARMFINGRKAVFALDYTTSLEDLAQNPSELCEDQLDGGVKDGLVKDVELTSAVRTQCGT